MTILPVPPSRPWLSMRVRLVSVPGLSLPYQLQVSRTRYFIPVPSVACSRSSVGLGPPAPPPAAVRPAAVLALDPRGVPYSLELGLRHPAQHRRVELAFTVNAVSSLIAALVELHADEHFLL